MVRERSGRSSLPAALLLFGFSTPGFMLFGHFRGDGMRYVQRLNLFMLAGVFAVGAVLLAPLTASAWEREPLSVYQQRRLRLVRETGGDGLIALFGYREEDVAASVTTFRQNEEFYYLTGWNEPEAMMLLVPTAPRHGEKPGIAKEILFIPPHNSAQERWTGSRLGSDDPQAPAETGFQMVESTARFHSQLLDALKTFSTIYTELTPEAESGEDCFQKDVVADLHKMAPLAKLADLRPLVTRMRMVKTPTEIALLRKAIDASIDAHFAAFKAVRPGVWEYQIAALMKYEFERRGCEWPAYPPIVGSGFYSTVLHYDADSRQMQDGDVVVMDVGGAYSGYTADITRTLPVNGRFTPRQREIYDIVLGAQNAVLAAARPGASLARQGEDSLYQIAYHYLNTHGKDLHGQPLGQYFIHGLGHSIGLNVHDPFDFNQPLEPGMVVTVEPGLYIPEEKIGIRIEDDILITKEGYELLTRRLPRTASEIEKLMSQK